MSNLKRLRDFASDRRRAAAAGIGEQRGGTLADHAESAMARGPAAADILGLVSRFWLRAKEVVVAAAVAVVATLIFYAEALGSKSLNAGVVYTGDFWHVWLPQVAKLKSLVLHGAFSGIDYSTLGGASEFFIRPGLYPYHPLLLLYALWPGSPGAVENWIGFSVLLLALHSFIGCFFTLRLASRYLSLGTGAAIFIAVGYAFSWQMVNAMAFPPFLLCAAPMPWAIYAGLTLSERPSLRRALLWSTPILLILLGGYSVIAITCIAMSAGFVAVYLFYIEPTPVPLRVRATKLAWAAAPFLVAGAVAFPLYWSMAQYFPLGRGSDAISLFHSAHEVGELPRTLLRLLSPHLEVPGPILDFTLVWGIIPVVICAIFFGGLKDLGDLSESEWRLFKFCASVYAFIVLAMYGEHSAVSDLFYLIPGIGIMHSYQRHLVAGQFFFIIVVALMLRAVVNRSGRFPAKVAVFALAAVSAFCAHAVAEGSPAAKDWHLNDYIVIELLFGLLVAGSLLVPGRWFAFGVATFLMFLTPLDHHYDFSTYGGLREVRDVQRPQKIALDKENYSRALAYFRAHSRKAIIKYIDLQPGSPPSADTNYFPRNFPWFTAMDLPLASYGGYEFLQAARASYGRRMVFTAPENTWIMRPDWKWVLQTGAEFAVYQEGFRLNDPRLAEFVDTSDASKMLHLPDNVVIAPLKGSAPAAGLPGPLRGRYVRVQLVGANYLSLAEVRVLAAGANPAVDLALHKPATQSSVFNLAAGASVAVDGNTNGDFTAGSVTHTKSDSHAWWQVDLGSSQAIGAVEIWNRTDGSQERLNDYWVFVSDTPFGPNDSPETLRTRPQTVGSHQITVPYPVTVIPVRDTYGGSESPLFDNGYLRVIGAPGGATVKHFQTDGATETSIDIDASRSVKVQYLFWPNERLKFYRQGRVVQAKVEDGLQTIALPAGRHGVEIRYVVTSLPVSAYRPQALYEGLYCARGEMENRIKEQMLLFADRMSAETMRANQLRLYLSAAAYVLLEALRRVGLKGTDMAQAQVNTIRLRLLKIGAQIRFTVRRVTVSMATAYPYRAIFAQAWDSLRC